MPFEVGTYTPNDALNFAKTMVKGLPLTDTTISYPILDYVAKILWMAAPWRWTIGSMTPFSLVAAQSDYSVTLPADFLYLEGAYLTNGNTIQYLHVDPWVNVPNVSGISTRIAHISGSPDKLRVSPTPTTGFTSTVVPIYKKQATKIVAGNVSTAGIVGIPDEWFPVYQAGVLWYALQYSDDTRAGTCQVDGEGRMSYTGQLAVFQSGLADMRASEKLPLETTQEQTRKHG